MQVSEFNFHLPNELIARYPTPDRTASRLMQLNGESGVLTHGGFTDLLDFLQAGDLLVLNNTRNRMDNSGTKIFWATSVKSCAILM